MRNQLTSTEIDILATKISQFYILLVNHETTSEEFIGEWVFLKKHQLETRFIKK